MVELNPVVEKTIETIRREAEDAGTYLERVALMEPTQIATEV